MFVKAPIAERVQALRTKYRESQPIIDITRYKLITEFYDEHRELVGIMRKAECFKYICENMCTYIDEDELFVGSQGEGFRAVALYPEVNFSSPMMKAMIEQGAFMNGPTDIYKFDPDDMKYVLDTYDFWLKNSLGAQMTPFLPKGYGEQMDNNGIITYGSKYPSGSVTGHFIGGFEMPVKRGYASIKAECEEKMAAMEGRIFGDDVERYAFYKAVSICVDGIQTLYRRYADAARKKLEETTSETWRAELPQIIDSLEWMAENPARNFFDALQCLNMHLLALALEGNLHGLSFGRLDTLLGPIYEADLAAGTITPEKAQEYMDVFFLKIAQVGKVMGGGLGYTTGLLMTLGGVDEHGHDITNPVSFMMLQASSRLMLHDPPMAMRVHKNTPMDLWEAAIECTKVCGGVPTFENDDVIIPSLVRHGMAYDDARCYGLVGCVEPGGNGNEWTAAGGDGGNNFFNLPNVVLMAMNNGVNPMPKFDGSACPQSGLSTGYLYEKESMDEVLDAVFQQMEYWINWNTSMLNVFEYTSNIVAPLPVASMTIEGCLESGKDVVAGGAKYNSLGLTGIGVGNIVDSLSTIDYLCFQTKKCTTRELYDAVMANWVGYEDLQQFILNECPHYGNADERADRYATIFSEKFMEYGAVGYVQRCHTRPGLWPVTANVAFGMMTWATFDGRNTGQPLSDGIGPVQSLDKNGPTAIMQSVCAIDQSKLGNGTLLNMRFHPAALAERSGVLKLQELMQTYFDMGGMQLQINVTSTETLRAAQEDPDKYKDLVVRIAGFSVYFVEMPKMNQDDLITRTELSM